MSVFLFQHHHQEMGPALGKAAAASAHRCLAERIPLEREISCRGDSEETTFFPMEKCIANVKEKCKEEQPGEEDTGRPQRLQSPYFLLSAPASVTCLPTFLLPKIKFYMPLKAGCSQQELKVKRQLCHSQEFMCARAETCSLHGCSQTVH